MHIPVNHQIKQYGKITYMLEPFMREGAPKRQRSQALISEDGVALHGTSLGVRTEHEAK